MYNTNTIRIEAACLITECQIQGRSIEDAIAKAEASRWPDSDYRKRVLISLRAQIRSWRQREAQKAEAKARVTARRQAWLSEMTDTERAEYETYLNDRAAITDTGRARKRKLKRLRARYAEKFPKFQPLGA